MVKFGKHLQTFQANEGNDKSLYVVPYNELKNSTDPEQFTGEWETCLAACSACFQAAMEGLWEQVFSGIEHLAEARGAVPDLAIHLYILHAGTDGAQELLTKVKHIYSTALINAEALRKLPKKFDKKNKEEKSLSPKLLPKLYASNFVLGQSLLESGILMIRSYLEADANSEGPPALTDEDDTPSVGLSASEDLDEDLDDLTHGSGSSYLIKRPRGRSASPPVNEIIHANRLNEFDWLKKMVQSCAPDEISHIVAHRGFHCINDNDDKRPLENSQSAYEAAWTSGISLCECDIALTRDEKLVLAHDDDFTRLALDPRSEMSKMKVSDLTFKEIMALPLKTGTRPPLLIDILRSARAIGEHAKLIIEIKPGNAEAGTALARMFLRHPVLMSHCAVIMSFDLYAISNLKKELNAVASKSSHSSLPTIPGQTISFPASMSLGNFARARSQAFSLGADPVPEQSPSRAFGFSHESADHFGVGLSVSQTDMKQHFRHPSSTTAFDFSQINGRSLPKIMLLTVAEEPKKPCELRFHIMEDFDRIDLWLKPEEGMLDGVYVQFEPNMMTLDGAAKLRELASKYHVGVWGDKKTPDDFNTFHWLVREGQVSYVNSDLPRSFKKKCSSVLKRGETTLT